MIVILSLCQIKKEGKKPSELYILMMKE